MTSKQTGATLGMTPGGLTADFSYSPAFVLAVGEARNIASIDPQGARSIILAALPDWTPISDTHLLPWGVLFDRELGPLAQLHDTPRLLLETARATRSHVQ